MKFTLVHAESRKRAIQAVQDAQDGMEVTIKPPKRTLDQNAALHAMLSDIAEQQKWNNETLSIESWKRLFCAALFQETMMPGLTGGIVIMPRFTRSMSRAEMSELMDFISAWGAERGVRWSA